MAEVGLRELRQQASEIVRRVEAGETITVTVSGRPAARLVPIVRQTWRSLDAIAPLLAGPADPDWPEDRARLRDSISDPWDPT